jgi:hypothetical protein
MTKIFVLPALCLLIFACKSTKNTSNDGKDLDTLLSWMSGDFSSQLQSQRDTDYFDIRLHIRPIWTADAGNHWLYVEQATAKAEMRPYRQRVYKVEPDGKGRFKSIVYTLPDEKKWIGGYKTPAIFDEIKPADLSLRTGCTVFLAKDNKKKIFAGSTKDADCESNLRGAKYASSKVTVTSKALLSWDQGFDEKGMQVWGATKGGYEFIKQ